VSGPTKNAISGKERWGGKVVGNTEEALAHTVKKNLKGRNCRGAVQKLFSRTAEKVLGKPRVNKA